MLISSLFNVSTIGSRAYISFKAFPSGTVGEPDRAKYIVVESRRFLIMEELFPPQKRSTWQEKPCWIGPVISFVTVALCSPMFIVKTTPCKFKHKMSFVTSMTDQESKILTVSLYREEVYCTADVRLDITNFNISPPENVQTAGVAAHQTTQVIWVLRPKSQGTFSYAVSFPGSQTVEIDTSTVTVTNDIDLPAWVTSILVPVAVAALGAFLTVPYWIDKCSAWIKERKGERKTQAERIRKRGRKR